MKSTPRTWNPKKHKEQRRKAQPGWRRARAAFREVYVTDKTGKTKKQYARL